MIKTQFEMDKLRNLMVSDLMICSFDQVLGEEGYRHQIPNWREFSVVRRGMRETLPQVEHHYQQGGQIDLI